MKPPANDNVATKSLGTLSRPRLAIAMLAVSGCLLAGIPLPAQGPFPFQNPALDGEARITDLLGRMTLDEKIQALSTDSSVPRLGLVGTTHMEGLHGLALGGPGHWEGHDEPVLPTTQFPQARGLGQTWDPALLEKVAAEEALETAYTLGKYRRGGRVMRSPNADLSRDPRWGRGEESYGEDPYLVGSLAVAFTRGLQGSGRYWTTASLLKHFLANSNEDGRDGSSSNFDRRLFEEYYSVPFRMAIEDGHANAMMTAYNAWNGVPMAANPVLHDVVMGRWGFDGILCTDAGALTNMVTKHHVFADLPHAAAAALEAGINQFLDDYRKPVEDALAQHLTTEATIDRNLRGVFRVMLRLGEFDAARDVPPRQVGVAGLPDGDPWWSASSRELALQATEESIVLLKNAPAASAKPLLPLASPRSIAVIGPLADRVALDWYSGTPPYAVTPLAAVRARAKGAKVVFDQGTDLAAAASLARTAEIAVVIVGNHPTCDAGWMQCALPSEGKEAIDRKSLTLEQESLVKAVVAANPHTVVVLQTSFPYTTVWTQEHVPAIVQMTHNSQEQGTALAAVLFGDVSPAGRLTQTWPAAIDDLPPMMDYDLRHGRTYLYATAKPLYAFGHGLSYTSFRYSNLRVPRTVTASQVVTATVDVTNTGARAGDEVVQLYISHQGSAVARPREELKAYRRVTIKPGQTLPVELTFRAKDLGYWDDTRKQWTIEADRVAIRVGASSGDIRLESTLAVEP